MKHSPEVAPDLILDLMEAFRRSKVLFAAVELNLFEILNDSPKSLQSLAAEAHLPVDPLEQLLTACIALGLMSRVDGRYQITPICQRYLVQASPTNLLGYIRYSDKALYFLWAHLAEAVREGTNRWEQVFGGRNNFFDNVYASPSGMKEFISGMHGIGLLTSPTLASAFDLSRFRHLVDIGGATGHLAVAACQVYPRLRATVFDLSPVCQVAQEYIVEACLQDRIQTQAGNFFTDPLPDGDLFTLARILHDWNDEKVYFLLRKCFERLPLGGAILICEKFLDEEKDGPVSAALQSLNMLVATEGKERTAGEYRSILQNIGFGVVEAKRTGKYLDVALAVKE
jgi:acetylserotonin N-methyltransferase